MNIDELRDELATCREKKEYYVASYVSRLLVMRSVG
jgi:hypothetical protein